MSNIAYLDNVRTQELITEIKSRLATKVTQYTSMPAVTATTNPSTIVLFTGSTTQDYTQGALYKADVTNLEWVQLTYTKDDIDALLSAAITITVVATLPTMNISTTTIYLVPKTDSIDGYTDLTATNGDVYVATGTAATPTYDKYEYDSNLGIYIFDSAVTGADAEAIAADIEGGTLSETTVTAETRETQNVKTEYINLTGTTAGWEKIGSTEVNLTDYVKFENLVPITAAELAAMWED